VDRTQRVDDRPGGFWKLTQGWAKKKYLKKCKPNLCGWILREERRVDNVDRRTNDVDSI
jgi:hypothetical protein